jgi:hypothetical protein
MYSMDVITGDVICCGSGRAPSVTSALRGLYIRLLSEEYDQANLAPGSQFFSQALPYLCPVQNGSRFTCEDVRQSVGRNPHRVGAANAVEYNHRDPFRLRIPKPDDIGWWEQSAGYGSGPTRPGARRVAGWLRCFSWNGSGKAFSPTPTY